MGGALATPSLASGIARAADDWPSKPVRYINLFPAGGATDVLSRVVCQQLSEISGQQFVVENKGGSGGNVGADAIARSAPDGYTVGLMSIASHAISPTLHARLPFDAEKDFTPISLPSLPRARRRSGSAPRTQRLSARPRRSSSRRSSAPRVHGSAEQTRRALLRFDLRELDVPRPGLALALHEGIALLD
ncbi:MAG TPA: tripartite tricarboxylate transporter substrate-binding protein, partial [Reyranella sp.]|nr:tripartite tricarboxylate transporter substrate-binding protein [Reyranella sp.]